MLARVLPAAAKLERAATRLLQRAPSIDLDSALSQYRHALSTVHETNHVLATEKDPAVRDLFRDSQSKVLKERDHAETSLREALKACMPVPRFSHGVTVEILAQAVGEDPADFASDVVKTLEAYAINRGWRWTVLDSRLVRTGKITLPGSAGVKWMLAEVEGSDVYRWMKWEHGDHRMLMETRAGKRQTSDIKCLILPLYGEESSEIAPILDPALVKIDLMRSSGPGGQHVNTTDSKVKLTHLPTGETVSVQSFRSQPQNRKKAFEILEARLFNRKLEEEGKSNAIQRRELLANKRVRSYVYYRNEVINHGLPKTDPLHTLSNMFAVRTETNGLSDSLGAIHGRLDDLQGEEDFEAFVEELDQDGAADA